MPGTPTTPSTPNSRASRTVWHVLPPVPPPVPPRVRRPQSGVSTVLCVVNTPPVGQLAPVTLPTFAPQPASPSWSVASNSSPETACENVRPGLEAAEDDNGWGSDFDDVSYTPQEQAEFDARFEREDAEIAAAQQRWRLESVTSRPSSGGGWPPR